MVVREPARIMKKPPLSPDERFYEENQTFMAVRKRKMTEKTAKKAEKEVCYVAHLANGVL